MERRDLVGINAIGEPVKLAKEVVCFTDNKNYFKVTIIDINTLSLVTPKGSYQLAKHPTLNIYQGSFNGHKVNISMKKIVGEIRYW